MQFAYYLFFFAFFCSFFKIFCVAIFLLFIPQHQLSPNDINLFFEQNTGKKTGSITKTEAKKLIKKSMKKKELTLIDSTNKPHKAPHLHPSPRDKGWLEEPFDEEDDSSSGGESDNDNEDETKTKTATIGTHSQGLYDTFGTTRRLTAEDATAAGKSYATGSITSDATGDREQTPTGGAADNKASKIISTGYLEDSSTRGSDGAYWPLTNDLISGSKFSLEKVDNFSYSVIKSFIISLDWLSIRSLSASSIVISFFNKY